MPDPSYWPLVAAVGLFIAGFGILFFMPGTVVVTLVGLFITMASIYGWSLEPVNG
jgi:hypothetical protein